MGYEFILSRMIQSSYDKDEFEPIIIYGPLGYGKSGYASRVTAELYGDPDGDFHDDTSKHWNWEAPKSRIVFRPEEFTARIRKLREGSIRDKLVVWDDAGVWLSALDHTDPYLKIIHKYLNLARTRFATIIFTSPLPTDILKKVRTMPQLKTAKVIKAVSDDNYPKQKIRMARIFKSWRSPDMKRFGVKEIARDKFNAILPSSYFSWYKPIRDRYAEEAELMLERETESIVERARAKQAKQAHDQEIAVLEARVPLS